MYDNPKLIECENCRDKEYCRLYKYGVRAMLRCGSYEPINPDCSQIANEETSIFRQSEKGAEE